jgi:Tfp pilus assembly ATPase PilU
VTAFTLIDLFERMAAAGASDLHLCSGSPPVLRVRGELERLELPPTSAEEMRTLVYRIATLDQQKTLEVERELDFSYGSPTGGGSASTCSTTVTRSQPPCGSCPPRSRRSTTFTCPRSCAS